MKVAAEKTNATLHTAAEQMRPHLTVMQRQISEASSSTWKFLSAAALQAADYTSKVVRNRYNDYVMFLYPYLLLLLLYIRGMFSYSQQIY